MDELEKYETRDLLPLLEYIHIPGDFLLTTFVTGTENHDSNKIEIDIERNGKKMAPFSAPVREGVIVTKEGFQTLTHTVPYIKMKTPFTAQEAMRRRAGSTVYDGTTPQAYISKEMSKVLKSLDTMIFRREEWMLAQGIQTGVVPIEGEGLSYVIDFQMKATHLPVLTGGDTWDETTSDIQDDLTTWADVIYDDSGRNADMAILGRSASKTMLRNEEFKGALDRRRIQRGEINVRRLPKGVKFFGDDAESGLSLWGYTEKFYDTGSQQFVDLINPKKVVVAATGARVTRHYGAIQNVRTNFIGPRWPFSWITDDPGVQWVSLESAPLVAPHEIDAFLCATVLP